MPIRARFFLRVSGFLVVLASGAFTSAAADSYLLSAITEEAARPPLRDGVMSLDLSVEPSVDEGGSAAGEAGAVQDDTTWHPRIEADPWAEALADSSRLAALIPRKPPPSYSIPINQQVQFFLDRFTRERRQVVDKWFGRAGRYMEMIRDTLRDHGLPEDLAFVAMIESGFNPVAVSRAGAKGLWQFMAGTARRYGLRVDQWVDERLDPEKSTLAAAAYLRDLYAQFGSWSLAQAAYNAGEMKVLRAIRSVGSKDFWALSRTGFLRQETKEFVPQIHAATVIGQDPSRYGFGVREHEPTEVDFVSVPSATPLTSIATASGVSTETLRSLNPVLVKGVTPPGGLYRLRVPSGMGASIHAALVERKSTDRTTLAPVRADVHVVRSRDTVSGIAKQYGISVADVRRWNNLPTGDRIRPGDRLVVADVRLSAARGVQPTAR
jgi:membrane-bound lytic murein transglycosylase D